MDRLKEFRPTLKIFTSSLLALLMIFFFIYNYQSLVRIFSQVNVGWLFTGFMAYVMNYGFRGSRLRIMIGTKKIQYHDALSYVITHGVLSYLLPLRSGDASLPVILKTYKVTNLKRGFAILLKTRVLDISMLGFFSLCGSYIGARMISNSVNLIWIFAAIGLTSLFFLFRYIIKIRFLIPERFISVVTDFSHFFSIERYEFFLTFMIWLSLSLSQLCMVRAIGLNLSLPEILFISTIQFPLQLLPIQGFANSGNHEGGWMAALTLMGFASKDAINFALASHCVLILYVLGLGTIGTLFAIKPLKLC